MPPGVLWVSSRIRNPSILTPQHFCDWYENTHIHEVTSLPGVPRAARYEVIPQTPTRNPSSITTSSPSPQDANPDAALDTGAEANEPAPWLTVYEMPDVSYRETTEFKGLDGQSEPRKELLEGVFKQARFDTRFYEGVQVVEREGGVPEGPAPLLISACLQPSPSSPSQFNAWYTTEHIPLISRIPGFRRLRRFKVINASVLDQFVRKSPKVPQYLTLCEFDGEMLPIKELAETGQTEWAREVMEGLEMAEVGYYRLKGGYGWKRGAGEGARI
ncbi:uncharacterized protein BDR25DRAFT_371866 [Lindgomyces ingoldianus]|uniref:Uncharacterized protein n=1 Tax=Lindgomyces ingoldianus TaxID=673940 RepID=A0ACB6QS17_9PLEO|nr:uncharacterized protein BDR25DRAFT_371866 [Lindgomyces ingoldianus]KAF2469315.1 hypothetical protein BDR25DRAFT_371866 [Lindgomyces ingoldianus]